MSKQAAGAQAARKPNKDPSPLLHLQNLRSTAREEWRNVSALTRIFKPLRCEAKKGQAQAKHYSAPPCPSALRIPSNPLLSSAQLPKKAPICTAAEHQQLELMAISKPSQNHPQPFPTIPRQGKGRAPFMPPIVTPDARQCSVTGAVADAFSAAPAAKMSSGLEDFWLGGPLGCVTKLNPNSSRETCRSLDTAAPRVTLSPLEPILGNSLSSGHPPKLEASEARSFRSSKLRPRGNAQLRGFCIWPWGFEKDCSLRS